MAVTETFNESSGEKSSYTFVLTADGDMTTEMSIPNCKLMGVNIQGVSADTLAIEGNLDTDSWVEIEKDKYGGSHSGATGYHLIEVQGVMKVRFKRTGSSDGDHTVDVCFFR